MKFLRLVGGNLRRKPVRTVLTVLSIMVAFALFGLLGAIRTALSQGVDVAGADRLVVRHKVSIIQLLPASYEADMEQLDGVAEATHATWFGGIYQEPANFFAQFPVKPDEYLAMYPEFLLPQEQKDAWMRTRTGAVAGRTTADRFGWKVGDKIPIQATAWTRSGGERTWEFDLVGIYDGAEQGTDTTQFLFHFDYFDEARAFGRGLVGWYIVRVEDSGDAAQVAGAIDREFQNSPAETKAETEGAFVQGFADQVGNIGAIIQAILSAVFFTILLVAGNTMAQSVRERTAELGVMKTVGFSDRRILWMVLAESLLLSVLAGGIGLALALGFVNGLQSVVARFLPGLIITPQVLAVGIVLVAALGVVAGLLPALRAMRLDVVKALARR